ncbi:glycoside hydrolase family 13 protein [Sporolactobacillus sp. Y61]|uniref:Glycoside hydrolase family 13 protein n=1 Tax=Sporolactobacillus sp. Y61 TaxID=3160863 RepID=A0AAU8IDJ6_9BACL
MDSRRIYFNSWSETYRKPFGTVQIGQSVHFAIDVPLAEVEHVFLVIKKDGLDFQHVEMKLDSENPFRFQISFSTDAPAGLYFYHFQIEYRNEKGTRKTVYYAKSADNFGGEGRELDDPSALQQYQLTTCSRYDPAPEWYTHGVIYHIFVDRFNNGNRHHRIDHPKKNSFIYATEEDSPYYIRNSKGEIVRWDFFGGNLSGIIEKLHTLRTLGITILYLSPVFEASSNHKYNTGDFRKIDPMFGSEKIFEKLVAKAGRMGIHIILDGVFNHVGADSVYFNKFGHYGTGGAYRDRSSPYYGWFTFLHYPDRYESWWNIDDLPSIDHNNESFRQFIYKSDESVIDRWTRIGIGGWRLDVADELPDDFITGIRHALDRYNRPGEEKVLIGEVWEDASNKLAYGKRRHYLEGGALHGVMNYPFRTLIIDLLLGRITARHAVRASFTLKSNYPRAAFFSNMNNIGTHDTERILSVLGGNKQKLKIAVWMLMTLPGVPCIYYGDEAGLTGGKDPDNRRFFPWGRENKEIETFFRAAIRARRTDENLQTGDYFPFSAGNLFGFIRARSRFTYTVLIFNPAEKVQMFSLDKVHDETGGDRIRQMIGYLFKSPFDLLPLQFVKKEAKNVKPSKK